MGSASTAGLPQQARCCRDEGEEGQDPDLPGSQDPCGDTGWPGSCWGGQGNDAWSLCWQEPLVQTWIPGLCVGGKIEMYVDIISNIANVGFFPRVADPLAHLLSKGPAWPSGPPQ